MQSSRGDAALCVPGLECVFPRPDWHQCMGCPGLSPTEADFNVNLWCVFKWHPEMCIRGIFAVGFLFCVKLPNTNSVLMSIKHHRGRTGCDTMVPLSHCLLPGRHKSSSQTPSTELGVSVTRALHDRGPTACKDKAVRNYSAWKSRSVLGDAVLSKLIPTRTSVFTTSSLNSLPIPLPLFLGIKMPHFLLNPGVFAALGP